jgi:hypothetical protein
MEQLKRCSKCKQEKPLSEFNKNHLKKDGLRPECRECQRQSHIAYYANGGKEKHRQQALSTREHRIKRWQEYATTEAGKAAIKRARRNRKYDPATAPAHRAVYRAVKDGKLARPETCQVCGRVARVEAHHPNGYDKEHYLDVIFACRKCHDMLDHGFIILLPQLDRCEAGECPLSIAVNSELHTAEN